MRFENMVAPFQLSTKGPLTLSISDIAFSFNALSTADMVCEQGD
jgi:hypothetical protein